MPTARLWDPGMSPAALRCRDGRSPEITARVVAWICELTPSRYRKTKTICSDGPCRADRSFLKFFGIFIPYFSALGFTECLPFAEVVTMEVTPVTLGNVSVAMETPRKLTETLFYAVVRVYLQLFIAVVGFIGNILTVLVLRSRRFRYNGCSLTSGVMWRLGRLRKTKNCLSASISVSLSLLTPLDSIPLVCAGVVIFLIRQVKLVRLKDQRTKHERLTYVVLRLSSCFHLFSGTPPPLPSS